MPPAKLTSTKRFTVRMSLVTGSTLAVIIGAQSLASLDKKAASLPDTGAPVLANPSLPVITAPSGTTQNQSLKSPSLNPASAAVHAVPTITILRHPGLAGAAGNATTQAAIKPPEPIQLAAPQPIIVQAPGAPTVVQVAGPAAPPPPASHPPTTRSSR